VWLVVSFVASRVDDVLVQYSTVDWAFFETMTMTIRNTMNYYRQTIMIMNEI
jgi:hypothetical protein